MAEYKNYIFLLVRILRPALIVFYFWNHHLEWGMLLWALFLTYFIGMIGLEIGFHRYFSHGSFKTGPFREWLMLVLGTLTASGSPVVWVGTHLQHHAHSDDQRDPHSPLFKPGFRILTMTTGSRNIQNKFIKAVIQRPRMAFIHRHYLQIISLVPLVFWLISPRWAVYSYLIPVEIILFGLGSVNYFCHLPGKGYRNHNLPDQSNNRPFMNYFVVGGGLHNNHHANPKSYTNAQKPGEVDFCGWVIKTFLMSKGNGNA